MSRPGRSATTRGLRAALAGLTLCAAGCVATAVGSPDATPLREFLARSRAQSSAVYRVQPGDRLTVRFYFNPQLDQDFVVRPDGTISLSVTGELSAAGKTATELSAAITQAYAKLFTKPKAVVIVRASTGYRAFTGGSLNRPGQIDLLTGAKTVLESLAVSGGVAEDGTLSHVYLIRQLPGDKAPIVAELNLKKALSGEDPSQDVALMPNDYVFVPRSSAANLNLAMQQYIFNNLNFHAGVGAGIGFSTRGSRSGRAVQQSGRTATTPGTGATGATTTTTTTTTPPPMTTPPPTQPPITTPARP